jgi:hypothetical protein
MDARARHMEDGSWTETQTLANPSAARVSTKTGQKGHLSLSLES